MDAPVDRLQSAKEVTFLQERQKCVRDARFVAFTHRKVWISPATQDTQTLEIAAMLIDVAQSEFPADTPKLHWSDAAIFAAELLFHLRLDGQTMAVPARDIGRSETRHGLRLYDHILENLVERGAEMNRARRIRRTIVQDVCGTLISCLLNPLVKPSVLPLGENPRFVLRKVGLHRKIRPREIQSCFQGLGHLSQSSVLWRRCGARLPGGYPKGQVFLDHHHMELRAHKVKSHMVQFIFEQVSLVTRASFWLGMNLTPWVELWDFDYLGRVIYATP